MKLHQTHTLQTLKLWVIYFCIIIWMWQTSTRVYIYDLKEIKWICDTPPIPRRYDDRMDRSGVICEDTMFILLMTHETQLGTRTKCNYVLMSLDLGNRTWNSPIQVVDVGDEYIEVYGMCSVACDYQIFIFGKNTSLLYDIHTHQFTPCQAAPSYESLKYAPYTPYTPYTHIW